MMRFKLLLITLMLLVVMAFKSDQQVIHPAIGDPAPDIALKNPQGEIMTLKSLRGKVVLVHFWASWCRSCRIENHAVRRAYSQYKDSSFTIGEGFEIYSVSLDSDSTVWRKAIKNDRLDWKHHVSDLKKWDSPVIESYNFRYLPHNVLIDSKGIIVAKSLLGDQLQAYLSSHVAE
ncbi:MAG TPA: TlpA family protein disulfide reductase [Bacteroidetes bacterium]|nr:TlpA family protein disulfide reductase [Bacteroidota bacterium]